jgi:hypothetical protein
MASTVDVFSPAASAHDQQCSTPGAAQISPGTSLTLANYQVFMHFKMSGGIQLSSTRLIRKAVYC